MLTTALALLAALASTPTEPSEPPEPLDRLGRLEDDIEDVTTLDRADLIDARDALLRSTRSDSIVLGLTGALWRRLDIGHDADGASLFLTLTVRPEAWLVPDRDEVVLERPPCPAVDAAAASLLAARRQAALAALASCTEAPR